MRIHLSDTGARDELARYLTAAGFTVDNCGSTTLEVDSPHGATPTDAEADLHVRVATWQAMHPGVTALIDLE
jgi:hypothetical protein